MIGENNVLRDRRRILGTLGLVSFSMAGLIGSGMIYSARPMVDIVTGSVAVTGVIVGVQAIVEYGSRDQARD